MINSLGIVVFRVWRARGLSPARRQPHGNNLEGGERVNAVENGQKSFHDKSIRATQKFMPSKWQVSANVTPMRHTWRASTYRRWNAWSGESCDSSAAIDTLVPPLLLLPEAIAKTAPRMLAFDEPVSFK